MTPIEPTQPTLLYTQRGRHTLELRVACSFWSRFRGLMFAPPLRADTGLLITRCASVHTCFMRAPVDVVYLNADGRVTGCVPHLRPWRLSASLRTRLGRTRHVLELAVGSIDRLGIQITDQLQHPTLGESSI